MRVSQVRLASFNGTPDWRRPRLAPAGDRFAAVRWHDGAANVWIGASRSPMQLASDLRPWRLRDFHWGADGQGLILALSQPGSDQRVLAWLDLRARSVTPLTADLAADAQYVGQLAGQKPGILIAVRDSPASSSRLQHVTATGQILAEWDAPAGLASRWLATDSHAVAVCADGPVCTWWHRELAGPGWSAIAEIPAADSRATRPVAFGPDGQTLYALSSAGRDTLALVAMSAPDWIAEVVCERAGFDLTAVLLAPDGTGPDLVTSTDPVRPQSALTAAAAADLSRLEQIADGAPALLTGRNSSHCLAEVSFPLGGPAYLTFGRAAEAVSKPLARYTGFARQRMQRRVPVSFLASDGRRITGFVTCPSAEPPWPTVLTVHGGPWSRDRAQLDPWAQYLAAAGLCCVQVNFRGSRGFGKEFRDAGDGQWAKAMQADLLDALRSPEFAAVTDLHRVAAIGHGYGGYAALMLSTQTELPLACAVSGSAPTDLRQYVAGLQALGGPAGPEQATRIGPPATTAEQLREVSPVYRAAEMQAPLLLFHGRQDPQVPVVHAEELAGALQRAGRQYELTIYADEGHRYTRPQNIADCRTRTLEFLLAHLRVSEVVSR